MEIVNLLTNLYTDVKATSDAEGTFAGYASRFNNVDRQGDVVEEGAFTNTLREAQGYKASQRLKYLWPLLWMHEVDKIIGGVVSAKEDAKGLYIEGRCNLNNELGRQVYAAIRDGSAGPMSIGYTPVRSGRGVKGGRRQLFEVGLKEISVLPIGYASNTEAYIEPMSVKMATERLGYDVSKGIGANKMLASDEEFKAWMGRVTGREYGVRSSRTSIPDMPEQKDFINDHEWKVAAQNWNARRSGVSEHVIHAKFEAEQSAAYTQLLQRKTMNGTATLAERRELYETTGRTPSGLPLPAVRVPTAQEQRQWVERALLESY